MTSVPSARDGAAIYPDRDRAMAGELGFEGHMNWAEAMYDGGLSERRPA